MIVEILTMPSKDDIIKTAAIAKTAYHSGSYEEFKTMSYEDAEKFLIKLIKLGHESSIEPLIFTFNVNGVSVVLTHQLVRHRMASFMQKSFRRKRKLKVEDFVYPKDSPNAEKIKETVKKLIGIYEYLCKNGESPDDARRILPMGMSTEITFTINARSLRNFLHLRLDKKASWEIRELAGTILLFLTDAGLGFLFRDIVEILNKKDVR